MALSEEIKVNDTPGNLKIDEVNWIRCDRCTKQQKIFDLQYTSKYGMDCDSCHKAIRWQQDEVDARIRQKDEERKQYEVKEQELDGRKKELQTGIEENMIKYCEMEAKMKQYGQILANLEVELDSIEDKKSSLWQELSIWEQSVDQKAFHAFLGDSRTGLKYEWQLDPGSAEIHGM